MARWLLGLLAIIVLSKADTPPTPSDLINQFMKENNVPGMFVAVVRDDSVLFKNGFGLANIEKKTPVTEETCMELGSISKAFTAEVIFYLHQKQLLNINDAITKYLTGAPAAWKKITIKHLLMHTSGIQNYLLDPRFRAHAYFGPTDPVSQYFFRNVATDSMLHLFNSLPVEFNADEGWSYSNTGYYILGKIAELVTGKYFFQLVKEQLTDPLKMEHTMANELALQRACLAQGYFYNDSQLKPVPPLTSNYAFSAGAWASNGADMIAYLKAIHRKALLADQRSYTLQTTRGRDLPFNYFGGRFETRFHGMKILSHSGGTPGFSSSWIYAPEKNISIIIMMNRQDYAAIDHLAWDILASFEPDLRYPIDQLNGSHEKEYIASALRFVRAVETGTPYLDDLAKPLRTFIESENGKGMWKWYFERGFPDSAYCVDAETINGSKLLRFRLPLAGKSDYRLTMVLNQKNQLTQIRWW